MRKVDLRPSTEIAALCLYGGLLCVFMLSGPAIMRRGYPEIDPYLLALPWLWPVPILLAAPFRRTPHLKDWWIIAYCAGVGAIAGGVLAPSAIPRSVSLADLLLGAVVFLLPLRALALVVELAGCLTLHAVGLRQADADLPPMDEALQGEKLARVWVYLGFVVLAAVLFPIVYHHSSVADAIGRGARMAERDWAAGEAWWPVMMDDPEWSHADQDTYDPRTGLRVLLVGEGLLDETWCEEYRRVIREKLAEHGPAPMVEYLLTEDEFRDFVAQGRFEPLDDYPFRFGKTTFHADGSIDAPGVVMGGSPDGCYGAVLPEKGGALVVIGPGSVAVFHPDGRYIQNASYELLRDLHQQLEHEHGDKSGANE